MAKKITDNTPIQNFEDDWGGTYQSGANAGKEWGKTRGEVERVIKAKVSDIEQTLDGKVNGLVINNQAASKDVNGNIHVDIPIVDSSLSTESVNAVQNRVVAGQLDAIRGNTISAVRTDVVDGDTSQLDLVFTNEDGTDFASVRIPAAQELGTVTYAKVTTELLTPTRIKLGDSISLRWTYDHIIQEEGVTASSGTAAQTVTIRAMIGTTEVYNVVYPNVAAGYTGVLNLGGDIITQTGTVNIYVIAQTIYGEEQQRAQGFKGVSVVSLSLDTTFDPASALAFTDGFTDGQTITIPYTYTVPSNSIVRIYKDGSLYDTATVSGTARGNVYLNASDLMAGRHNIQMVAESSGLLSNVVCVDLLKAGGTDAYIGMRMRISIDELSEMPLEYEYGDNPLALTAEQFGNLNMDVAVWQSGVIQSDVTVTVDDMVTQSLAMDRTLHVITQRFDTSGEHTLVIGVGNTTREFVVTVAAAAGITESEAIGYRTKLTANGRSNNESESTRSNWGGITEFDGVNFSSNGWERDTDGVDSMLLTNGARMITDIKPFVLDSGDNDYSIQTMGMTFEVELKISQVVERGATILSCLWDNDNNGYPMGIKITTEEAGLYFGGVEEIETAEDLTDSNGNYIDYEGNIVDAANKVPLKITRPRGIAMDIARDQWLHLSFVVLPESNGYGIGMLYINGSLSRANLYSGALRQTTPQPITTISDGADVRVRGLRYYRTPLIADEVLGNWIIDRPTALQILAAHNKNAVGDANNTADADGNIEVNKDAVTQKSHGVLQIIRSGDSGNGLEDLLSCVDKKQDFLADIVKWTPPLDSNGNSIGEGFEARNVVVRIQGTSSVKYPYKNIRIYLTKAYGSLTRSLSIGGVDVTGSASGYPLRGIENSIPQSVLCAKTDFVDSSMAGNAGGAHLFDSSMRALGILTPPQEYDARVRQAIDGIPCDIFAGKSEQGTMTYYGQFVLNNEKSKSGGIFGMEGVEDFSGDENLNPMSIALEALDNNSPMTLFQPAGSANSQALDTQLSQLFDNGFEFNYPEDAVWANIDEGQWNASKSKWDVKPVPGARAAIKRLLGWIYDCVPSDMRTNPEYGTPSGWNATSKAKWVSSKFKNEVRNYFNLDNLLSYYADTDYKAGKDQLAKNIIWRTWDGLIWYATYYDGDTWEKLRNDAFMVYSYNITRDSYDYERAKYAFEGHSSWLWCLVLANLEDELKQAAVALRNVMTSSAMVTEYVDNMIGNWSEREYNKSCKLKYIDTVDTMNYIYTLTGSRKEHIQQYIKDRGRLLDAKYGAGDYNGDVVTFTVVREANDEPSSLTLTSGDLYYFGYKLNNRWLQGPEKADVNEQLTLIFTQRLATNDPLMLGGASCIKELDLTDMGSQLNGVVNLSLCTMLSKLVMPATNGVANAPLTLGNTSKLQYIDITDQTAIHTGTSGVFDVSKHIRLQTLLAGGTSLTAIKLAEGAEITTLVMPDTLEILTLRYLPKLHHSGLTLEGTSNITALNIAGCPYLDWKELLRLCPNVDHVRIEGMSGRVRSSSLRVFMSGYMGLTANGIEQTYPALIGDVELIDVVDDFEEMRAFFERCGLTIRESQYSEYIFDDEETDPANITNEDNQTGYAYLDETIANMSEQPNKYVASGHVALIHDKCQLCSGRVNNSTHKMRVTKLSKNSLTETADGNAFNPTDPNGEEYDVFMYLPHYWYKGVNDYKNARKHFFVSANDQCPASTATNTIHYQLSNILYVSGKAITNELYSSGATVDDCLTTATEFSTYRVLVEGMKQVRFPGINHSYFSHVFEDANGNILSIDRLLMADVSGNPADFMNDEGDYDFRTIPEGAKYLYFCCRNAAAAKSGVEVIVTDSSEIEAIEPNWVEHLPELIGVYQGYAAGITTGGTPTSGLRSISGKVVSRGRGTSTQVNTWSYDSDGNPTSFTSGTRINGTALDFYNLARVRTAQTGVQNGEYTTVPYETSKDMANLLMAWFGTRDVETIVGRGSNAGETTGVRNAIAFGDSDYTAQNQHNKMWGLECWTASTYEWMDNGSFNTRPFKQFLKDHRQNNNTNDTIDYYYNILQQDGNERRVKAATTNQAPNVARVRFGRYCDIVVGSYAGDTSYATCYAAYQSSNGSRGCVLGRSGDVANANAGVAYSDTSFAYSSAGTLNGGRLCFFGEIENEEDLL